MSHVCGPHVYMNVMLQSFLNFEKFSPVLNFVEVVGEAELYPYSLWFSAGTLTKKQINKRKTSSLLKEKGHVGETETKSNSKWWPRIPVYIL